MVVCLLVGLQGGSGLFPRVPACPPGLRVWVRYLTALDSVPRRGLKLAHPRLGPISRISLRLFQLSNPSIRLQNPPRLSLQPSCHRITCLAAFSQTKESCP